MGGTNERGCVGAVRVLLLVVAALSALQSAFAQEVPCSVTHYVNANERRFFVFQRAGVHEDMLCVFTFQTDADISLGVAVTRFDFGEIQDNNCSCGTIRIFDITPSGDLLLAQTCSKDSHLEPAGPIVAARASNNVVVVTLSTHGCPGPNLCLEVGDLDDSVFQNTTSGYTETTSVSETTSEETTVETSSSTTTITATTIDETGTSVEPSDQTVDGSETTVATSGIDEETTEDRSTTTVEDRSISTVEDRSISTVEDRPWSESSVEWRASSESTIPTSVISTSYGYEDTTHATTEDLSTTEDISTKAENIATPTSTELFSRSESAVTENFADSSTVTEGTSLSVGTSGTSSTGSSDLTFPDAGDVTPGVEEKTSPEYHTRSTTEETRKHRTHTGHRHTKPTTHPHISRSTSPRSRRKGTRSSKGPKTTTETVETTTKKKWWWPFG